TVQSEIINIHGAREELQDDVPEIQDLVISTYSLPPEDWRRTRVFSWMAAFLHFDKLLQLPMMVACEIGGLSYCDIIDAFLDASLSASEAYPVYRAVGELFEREGLSRQNGGPEYVYSKKWLGIHWPADEYMFIKLTAENKLPTFYEEAGRLLPAMIEQSWPLLEGAVREAIKLNAALISQPSVRDAATILTRHTLLALCDGLRRRNPPAWRA